MEYANHLNEYAPAWSAAQVDQEVTRIREAAKRNHNTDVYKMCYSAIDLTTLSCNDSVTSVTEFARKAAEFYQKYPHIPQCRFDLYLSGIRRDRGTGRRWHSDAHYECGRRVPCSPDLPRSEGPSKWRWPWRTAPMKSTSCSTWGRMLTGEYDGGGERGRGDPFRDGRRHRTESHHRVRGVENPDLIRKALGIRSQCDS